MQTEVKNVKTKGKVVSEAEVPIYESLSELTENETEGRILTVFNKGNHVRIMGNERAKFSPTYQGKKMKRKVAFELLTTEELMAVAQDADALNEKLDSDEMQKRVNDHLNQEPPTDTTEATEEAG